MPMTKARRGGNRGPQRKKGSRGLVAAVDLGTNNCRMLIAERRGGYFRVLDSFSQIVRLGEGLAETGELSDAAMGRTIDALTKIRTRLRKHGVTHVRCIATEACRRASNGRAFAARAQAETGLSFKIISGHEEARLAAIGCHDLIDPAAGLIMVLDIGGGSTEISFLDVSRMEKVDLRGLVRNAPIVAWRSFPVGVVTLSDLFTPSRSQDDEGFADMAAHARNLFADWKTGRSFVERMAVEPAHIIGTSGTVTCLAGVHLQLNAYKRNLVDGSWMSAAEGTQVIDKMISVGSDGRAQMPTIGEERAALMAPGCAILRAAWDIWPARRMRIADRGLREGLLLSMIHNPTRNKRRRSRTGSKPSQTPSDPS